MPVGNRFYRAQPVKQGTLILPDGQSFIAINITSVTRSTDTLTLKLTSSTTDATYASTNATTAQILLEQILEAIAHPNTGVTQLSEYAGTTITAIDTDPLSKFGGQSVTITGTGFSSITTPFLSLAETVLLYFTNVVVVDNLTITADTAAIGEYVGAATIQLSSGTVTNIVATIPVNVS